jgi:hypothetical protein
VNYDCYVEDVNGYGVFVADATGEIEAFLWWRGINRFPRVACIKPTGTCFTRKHRAYARAGLLAGNRKRQGVEEV